MINNPQVPAASNSELRSRERARERVAGMLSRTTIATILAVAAVAALAITSLAQSERTQSSVSVQPASAQTLPASAPRDAGAVGRFVRPRGGRPGSVSPRRRSRLPYLAARLAALKSFVKRERLL
jgi:hypothetical protein